jgi:uncharacterized protein YndB with AHSA1/START domain
MNTIKDEFRIQAPASKVYAALTIEAGYRGWWNKVAEVGNGVGREAKLHFIKDGQPVTMRYRIEDLQPDQSVRWACVAHDFPSWVGTTLSWQLKETAGVTLVSFEHGGWKETPPEPVVMGWKHFCGSLKAYVEMGKGEPW